ncbi:MAG: glycosyltransferase family 4 protein [Chitinispirillaceae bacterium]|nr:glycosyltransferase family 4 protein [Chitinispirillaceae bacterium]
MRVAFDTYNLGITAGSGNRTYTVELIKALAGLGTADEWRCITYWRKKRKTREIFGNGPRLVIKNIMPNPLLLGRHLMSCVDSIKPFFEHCATRDCDLFHCTNPIHYPLSLPNVVTTIHDLIALHDEPWVLEYVKPFFRRNISAIVNRSIAIFADSECTRSDIIERFPAAKDKTAVIPLAVNPCFTRTASDRSFLSRYGLGDSERPYLLSVGEIQPRKNTLAMIECFESLAGRFPGVNFILIGQARKNDYTGRVLRHVADSPLRGRIRILHSVGDDDLVRFYNHAEGMVYYSFFEGFGLPILEAMACGCPVATSRTSSMTEIAEGAAIMVDPCDFDSMRNGMLELLDQKALREELREKGLKRAAQYSWKKTAELTYAGYKKALNQ